MAAALAQPLDLTPASPAAAVAEALEMARRLQALGREREAAAALAAVLQARPHLGAVQRDLAQLRLRLGEAAAVAKQLQGWLALAGADLAPALREELEALLLEALLQLERWIDLEPLLLRRQERHPLTAQQWQALALAALQREDAGAAMAHLQRAIQQDPDRAALHRQLAQLQRQQGQWAEALASCGRALALNPRDGALEEEAHRLRSEALWAQAEDALAQEAWPEARAAYGALLEHQPDHPHAAQRLQLLEQLNPARLRPSARWLAAVDTADAAGVQRRLQRFSRLLDRLEAEQAPPPPR